MIVVDYNTMHSVHSNLTRGLKKQCADFLGIKTSALSRYINKYHRKYNGVAMPEHIIKGIQLFIKTK